jgi:glycogen(starch) synthase
VIKKRELKVMRLIQEYLEWIRKEFQPDLIHLNAAVGGSAFAFFSFMKMFSIPIVLTVHVPCFHSSEFSSFGAKIADSADRIICVSNWVLDEMKRQAPSLRDKISLIYNGLPMPSTIPSPLCFSPPTLLLFGRLSPEKGFKSALIAFSLLRKKRSDVRLIIAGGGPERSSLEKLASELGLSQWVEFTGVLPQEKVSDTLNRATLVIAPSIIESFGLVLLESMQMQRPVIASRVEGIPEVVSDGETGLLVPPQDPSALCEAIWTLLDQPELAIKMGLEGYKKAMQFPLSRNVDQFECLYKELFS